MEIAEFIQTFQELCLAFRAPLSEKETKVYYKYLKKYSIDEFKIAVANIITSLKYEYFPRISHCVNECEKARRQILSKKQQELLTCEETEMSDILEFFKNDK